MNKRWAIMFDASAEDFNKVPQPDPNTIHLCDSMEEAFDKAKEDITECNAESALVVEITAFAQIRSKRNTEFDETKLEVKENEKAD